MPFVSERPLDNVEIWMNHKDGSTACVILSCVPLMAEEDGKQRWKGTRGVCRNVTEERDNESALARARRREQHLNYIVSTIRDELEPHNMLNAAAAATARALGVAGCRIYRRDEENTFMIAAEHGNTEGLDDLDARFGPLESNDHAAKITIGKWQVLATATNYRQRVNGALSIWKAASDDDWEDDHQLLISDIANQLGIANEQISNHERIVALSRTDSMTGLLNRRAFYEEELPRRVHRLEHNREKAALFYLDMDNFKQVNDIHGHQAGDDALLFLRDLLMEMSRPGDVIARLGGDEFAMWLDGISEEVSETRAARLIKASQKMRQFSGDDDHPLGISVGVAEELPRRVHRLEHNREKAALFYLDMDNFKQVNDIHGHQAGDDALLFLRDLLMEMSRPGDVIARLGGDEFAMWLDGISEEVSETRAARLIKASQKMRQFSGDDDHPLGISVGVAMFDPETDESLDDLIARADAAMYEVKNRGKGGYHMANPPGSLKKDKNTAKEDTP